jgi:hypothetical protein
LPARRPLQLLPLIPVAVIALVWLALEITAYRYGPAHHTVSRLWADQPFARARLVLSIVGRLFGSVAVLSDPRVGIVPIAAFAWAARRSPVALGALAAFLLCAAVAPLASGGHSLSQRFAYYPLLPLCAFVPLLAAHLIAAAGGVRSRRPAALAFALLVAVGQNLAPWQITDLFTARLLGLAVAVAVLLLWRARLLAGRSAVLLAIAMVLPAAGLFNPDADLPACTLAATIFAVVIGVRNMPIEAALTTALLTVTGPVAGGFWLATQIVPTAHAQREPDPDARTEVPDEGELG